MMKLWCIIILSLPPINNEMLPRKLLKDLPESIRDEVEMTVPEILTKYKYPAEVHHVVTDDGYILTLHRIPRPKSKKGVAFVMHGLLSSSTDWIIMGPNHGLGYYLFDEGYDVWLDPNSREFWNFSWHEIGVTDVPAMIDHILDTTKRKKLFHIGHSQGSTTFYVMCSMKPQYNEKIRAHFSLAPVGYVRHMHSPFMQFLANMLLLFQPVTGLIGSKEFFPKDGIFSQMGQTLCKNKLINNVFCTHIMFTICGYNPRQLNKTMVPLILSHIPAGSSSKQFIHYAQEINSGLFRQFDYGRSENMKRYNAKKPTNYNLTQIQAPLYFFYSKNDWLSSSVDVVKFAKELKSLKGKFLVTDEAWDHLDYLFGNDAVRYVYSKVLSLMTRH